METGTVKFYDQQKGFGFISPDNGEDDVFVHESQLVASKLPTLSKGQRVSFDVCPATKGFKAIYVRPA